MSIAPVLCEQVADLQTSRALRSSWRTKLCDFQKSHRATYALFVMPIRRYIRSLSSSPCVFFSFFFLHLLFFAAFHVPDFALISCHISYLNSFCLSSFLAWMPRNNPRLTRPSATVVKMSRATPSSLSRHSSSAFDLLAENPEHRHSDGKTTRYLLRCHFPRSPDAHLDLVYNFRWGRDANEGANFKWIARGSYERANVCIPYTREEIKS